ncbi:hypothetical protein FS842_005918, partial [Serendipita sp. 407]
EERTHCPYVFAVAEQVTVAAVASLFSGGGVLVGTILELNLHPLMAKITLPPIFLLMQSPFSSRGSFGTNGPTE